MALKEVDRIISEVNELDENERNIFIEKIEKLYVKSDEIIEENDPIQSVFGLWKSKPLPYFCRPRPRTFGTMLRHICRRKALIRAAKIP